MVRFLNLHIDMETLGVQLAADERRREHQQALAEQ
jgi:hypothetical protein